MVYVEFVDTQYKPKPEDLVCEFLITPARGFSLKEAAGRVASESSIGTWAELNLPHRIKRIGAKAFKFKGNYVKIAYPPELFEKGNMPQILSSIAGNVFGMKALKHLRLLDVRWPHEIVDSFKGPQFGIQGVRKIFGVFDRPLTATVPKPKVGLTSREHAQVGYEAWVGGVDLLKDDENLTDQSFNRFKQRAEHCFKMREKAEKGTGEKKCYLINVSAETEEMIRRAKLVHDLGGEYAMVDVLTVGWAGLQTLRNEAQDLHLALHAHRAFHAAFTRNKKHGMSMLVLADVCRLIGVDQLHIGTVVGKLESPKEEVMDLDTELTHKRVKEHGTVLRENWRKIKPVLPVCSGGLHPGLIPYLIKLLGKDIVIQVGGGISGHPDGVRAGASAVRQSIDAAMKGIPLREHAKKHPELKSALDMWGYARTK
jgi:ribulose-bisphosphate carboxylase large chain